MAIITNETIANGANMHIRTFEQIKKMKLFFDGSKEWSLNLIQAVYPNWTWDNLNTLLVCLSRTGFIDGLTIENNQVMEPVRPNLTDKARAEIEAKKEIVAEHE